MPSELFELADRFLPSYLLPGTRRRLLEQIDSFPHTRGYYSAISTPDYLQGDGWTGFIVFNFISGERRSVRGLVISNSCDVAAENSTVSGQRVVFAPVIRLERFEALLKTSDRTEQQVQSTIDALKKQHINNAFYLPQCAAIPESLILLDDLHSVPLDYFWAAEKTRLFRLSDFGFWLFLLKLSIHLTRLHEEVERGELA